MRSFEIRVCESCGLRYPLVDGQSHGTRCPICMGATRVALSRELVREPHLAPDPPLRGASRSPKRRGGHTVLLDNIRSAWNVGSILRSAEGFGFAHAYLCGITPTPENDAVRKTSLGAEDSVTWSHHNDAVKLVKGLKAQGWNVFGLEESVDGVSISSAKSMQANSVLIVGNEVTGIDPDLLDLCDEILTIPMRGEKKSFNVAIAFGIAAYQLHQ